MWKILGPLHFDKKQVKITRRQNRVVVTAHCGPLLHVHNHVWFQNCSTLKFAVLYTTIQGEKYALTLWTLFYSKSSGNMMMRRSPFVWGCVLDSKTQRYAERTS
jgi:hypothetical protein